MTKRNFGKEFEEALARIEQIEERKKDVTIRGDKFRMDDNGKLFIDNLGQIDFTKTGFQHFCIKADLPSSYMMKLLDKEGKTDQEIREDLETYKVNMKRGLSRLKNDKDYFIRTIQDGSKHRVRAIFSDNYKVYDNIDILRALQNFNGERLEAKGFSVTSDFMDIRFTMPELKTSLGRLPENEVRFGVTEDIVFPGVHLRNSETGGSKILGRFIIYRLVCTNGLTNPRHEFKIIEQKHMGIFDVGEINERMLEITEKGKELFITYVENMKGAKDKKVDPDEAFDIIGARKNISKKMVETVRQNWIVEQNQGTRKFDIVNAVTAGARDWEKQTGDYTGRLNLETVAGELLFGKAL